MIPCFVQLVILQEEQLPVNNLNVSRGFQSRTARGGEIADLGALGFSLPVALGRGRLRGTRWPTSLLRGANSRGGSAPPDTSRSHLRPLDSSSISHLFPRAASRRGLSHPTPRFSSSSFPAHEHPVPSRKSRRTPKSGSFSSLPSRWRFPALPVPPRIYFLPFGKPCSAFVALLRHVPAYVPANFLRRGSLCN